ncbi:hypothetical protein CsSME_00019908 [Camellia sinensis var. sinensis]
MYCERESRSNLKKMTVLPFGNSILFRSSNTTGLIKNTMGFKICPKHTINIFSAILTLEDFNTGSKLSKHHLMKCLKIRKNFILGQELVNSSHTRIVINESDKPPITRHRHNMRETPYIRMNNCKRKRIYFINWRLTRTFMLSKLTSITIKIIPMTIFY